MNEFRPMLKGDASKLEKLLLSSSRLDVPPRNAKRRAFNLLGLGSSVIATAQLTSLTTATAATQATGVASAVATGTSVLATTGATSGLVLALSKGLVIGALTGTLAYGSLTLHEYRARTAPSATHSSATIPARTASEPDPSGTSAGSERTLAVASSAPTSHESGSLRDALSAPFAVPRQNQPASQNKQHSSLQSERANIELARTLVRDGDARAALRMLSEHAWRYPKPQLAPEATLVRIEALLKLGQLPEAQRLGSRFLLSQPDGPYAQRVRTLLNR